MAFLYYEQDFHTVIKNTFWKVMTDKRFQPLPSKRAAQSLHLEPNTAIDKETFVTVCQ
jgi:hypothetical protein